MIPDSISQRLTKISTRFIAWTAMAIIAIWFDWAEPNLALFIWLIVFGLDVSEQFAEEFFTYRGFLTRCLLSLLIFLPWAMAAVWVLDGLNMTWFVPLITIVGGFCVFTSTMLKLSEK